MLPGRDEGLQMPCVPAPGARPVTSPAAHTRARRPPGDARREIRGRTTVGTIGAMAYDQELSGRIQQLIGTDLEVTEKKMFGGLAFLIRGNMAIAASGQGGAL